MSFRKAAGSVIITGVVFIVSALILWNSKDAILVPDGLKLPKSLGGSSLTEVSSGSEAVEEITRLHNKDLSVVNGVMGMYGNSNQATLWVAEFSDASSAGQALQAMKEKISLSQTPFTETGNELVEGRTIYHLEGLSQKHIYFQSDRRVIWLAVDSELSGQSFQETLRYYP